MIETGTTDQIKDSILGNIAWTPGPEDCLRVKEAFEAQDLKVTTCFVKPLQTERRYASYGLTTGHVIRLFFQTKRDTEGAMAKSKRAIRSLRLAMCHFSEETPKMSSEAIKVYSVEVRGSD